MTDNRTEALEAALREAADAAWLIYQKANEAIAAMPLTSAGVGEDWLIAQLEAWPKRVDPDKTTNIGFLMRSAAARLRQSAPPSSAADFSPCPTCHQYSHGIGDDQLAAAFNHFQSLFSHRGDGIPTQHSFDESTRDAAQVLMAAACQLQSIDWFGPPRKPLAAPLESEAVAWRYRYIYPAGAGPWTVRQSPIAAHEATPGFAAVEVEPLFIAALSPRQDDTGGARG